MVYATLTALSLHKHDRAPGASCSLQKKKPAYYTFSSRRLQPQ